MKRKPKMEDQIRKFESMITSIRDVFTMHDSLDWESLFVMELMKFNMLKQTASIHDAAIEILMREERKEREHEYGN